MTGSGFRPSPADQLAGLALFDPATPRQARRSARDSIAPRADLVREAVFRAIQAAPDGLTADEAAAAIGESVLTCRPRTTELQQAGRILPTACRRRNASGRLATVWRAA